MKKLFKKKQKKEEKENILSPVQEVFYNGNSQNSMDTAILNQDMSDDDEISGATVLLNGNTHNDINDDTSFRSDDLYYDNEPQAYTEPLNQNLTEPLDATQPLTQDDVNFGENQVTSQNFSQSNMLDESFINDSQGNDFDTVILSKGQNDCQYHSGNTVVLKKNTKNGKIKKALYLINPSTGEQVQIMKSEFKIGSDLQSMDLCILQPGISHHHSTIYIQDSNSYCILDCGSTNGTELDGKTLMPFRKYNLEDGMLITFADELYQFYIGK